LYKNQHKRLPHAEGEAGLLKTKVFILARGGGVVIIIVFYSPILWSIIDGIMSFNKDCKTGIDLAEIRIEKAPPLLLTVHFKLNLSVKTETRSFTSARVKL